MNIWNQVPFLRLLLPFLAGILTSIYSGFQFESVEYVIISLFLLFGLFVFLKKLNVHYKYSWTSGILITSLLFCCGIKITELNTQKFNSDHFIHYEKDSKLFYVRAISTPLEKEKSYKLSLAVTAIKQNDQWIPTSGKVIAYFEKDSLSKNIRYGDRLILKSEFSEVRPPQNPSEFNYKRFLAFHNIYHQAYVPSAKWIYVGVNEGNAIIRKSIAIREYLLNIYRENKIMGDEFAVGSALVLGYTDMLDQDLISAYASSGALHVLSVSGLHVGIIYVIFNSLLFFLDKFKHGKFLKMVLLLAILWSYAILTGLSPSVLRSAAMFSFIAIGQTWKYHTNIFNTLATSCFGLLLYNPFLIMEVGFQLSYLAVLGIVAIQPWIYERWQPNSWLTNQMWQIISVSIAAQLATFPLGLLYFHQFPNYFLFSNLLVIPVSTLILGYGLLMFILGKISAIGITCGKIFTGLVWFLNRSVQAVDQTPGALIEGISISILETWIIYALIIFGVVFIYKKQLRYLSLSLISIILLLSMQTIEARSTRRQKAIVIYSIPKTSAYDFIDGNQTLLLADSTLIHNQSRILFHIRHNWWEKNITHQELAATESKTNISKAHIRIKDKFIQFNGKKIVIINSDIYRNFPTSQKLKVDLLLISKNPKMKIRDVKARYEFKKIIFDPSNSLWKIKKWKQECEEMKVEFYSVPDSGAFIEEI